MKTQPWSSVKFKRIITEILSNYMNQIGYKNWLGLKALDQVFFCFWKHRKSQRDKVRDCDLKAKMHFLSAFNCIQWPTCVWLQDHRMSPSTSEHSFEQLLHLSDVILRHFGRKLMFWSISVMETSQGCCLKKVQRLQRSLNVFFLFNYRTWTELNPTCNCVNTLTDKCGE